MTVERRLAPATVNVRIKIAALWASMLFVSAHILASAVEVARLAGIVHYAWSWPRESPRTSTTGRVAPTAEGFNA